MQTPTRALVFLVAVLLVTPTLSVSEERSIKLGYLLDLTNKGAFMGVQSRAGAQLAARELQSSGIPVEVLFEDHKTEGKTGATGAQKLISVDDVHAMMCDLTPPCIAASPIVKKARRLFVYQAPIVSILESNPYSFKNFLDYESGCHKVGEFWKSRGIQRIVHYQVNAEFGELCSKGAAKAFPGQLLIDYDAGTEMRSLVLRGKTAKPQAVFQTGYEGDYISRLKAEKDLNLSLPTGMPEPLVTDVVIRSAGALALEGSVTFGFEDISLDFVSRLKQAGLYNNEVAIQSAAIAYVHVIQLVGAIRNCPPADVECQAASLAESEPSRILGFKGWKSRIAEYDYQLKLAQGGKLVRADVEQTG